MASNTKAVIRVAAVAAFTTLGIIALVASFRYHQNTYNSYSLVCYNRSWWPVNVEYHAHALRRMLERRVSEPEVEATLKAYETELPGEFGRRNRYKMIDGRRIRVTFDATDTDTFYVWTVTANEIEVQA